MDRETLITAIVAFIVAVLDLIKIFFGIDFGIADEQILAVVTVIVGLVCYWRNQNWTQEALKHTGAMRLEKAQRKGKINGENFYNDIEDVEMGDK